MKIKTNNLIIFLVLIMAILPSINLGFGMPVLYLLLPICFFIFILIIIGLIKTPKILKIIICLFLLIIVEIFISTMYGTITTLNKFIFPTDAIQYIARLLCLTVFILMFYKGKVSTDTFIKYFLIVLNIGMLIGILQWIPWPGRELLVKIYPFREGAEQLSQLNRPLHLIRIHGIAQHATANGGLATFFFIFGYSVFKYYKKYRFSSIILMVFSIVNVFASQARAGILALAFSFIFFYFINMYISRRSFKPTLYMITSLLIILFVFVVMYNNGNPIVNHMVYRWVNLFESKGGGRVNQAKYFFSLLKSPMGYIFGLSKQVVNQSAISYGVEIEPINIFITYGAIGFILQYSLVGILLIYFLRRMRRCINNKACLTLLVASFVGLFSYQIFSVAYFFFREIRVGLFPWILMGVAIGVYEKYKKDRIINEDTTHI